MEPQTDLEWGKYCGRVCRSVVAMLQNVKIFIPFLILDEGVA
jgi:hypothetical protein